MTLLEQTLGRLRAEHTAAGKTAEFEQLKGVLMADRGAIDYTAVAQMAEIDHPVLTALLQNATTDSGLLVNATRKGAEIYQWSSDHWSYTNAQAIGKGEGFCGMGRDRQSDRFRIRYRVSRNATDNSRYPVTAEVSYEGRTPPKGTARAFFIPFGRDQQLKYLVISFTAKTAAKNAASEPPTGESANGAVKPLAATNDLPPEGYVQRLAHVVTRAPATNGTVPLTYQWRSHEPSSPPTVEQILARYAQAKGELAGPDKTTTLAIKATFTSRDRLGNMQAEALIKAPNKWLQILKDANGPVWQRGFDASAAWEVSKWGGTNVDPAIVLLGQVLVGLYRGDPLATLFPTMSYKGTELIGGGRAYVLEVPFPGQHPRLWFDTQTGLLVRIECGAGPTVMQMDWDDYRDIGGLMVPFKVREAGTENWLLVINVVKRNDSIDDNIFKRPAQ